jgi:hypothetical protein
MLNIHDIKPLEEIPDYSIYFYYGGIVFLTLITLFILYMSYTFIQKKKKPLEKTYFKILQNIDFFNPKTAAYTISKYGTLLVKEERQKTLLMELNNHLETYKYKKEVPKTIDKKTKTLYETFMDSIDV